MTKKDFSFQCRGCSFSPWLGIPHVFVTKTPKTKEKQYCNKFNKDFKKWRTLKKNLKKLLTIMIILLHGNSEALQAKGRDCWIV